MPSGLLPVSMSVQPVDLGVDLLEVIKTLFALSHEVVEALARPANFAKRPDHVRRLESGPESESSTPFVSVVLAESTCLALFLYLRDREICARVHVRAGLGRCARALRRESTSTEITSTGTQQRGVAMEIGMHCRYDIQKSGVKSAELVAASVGW